MEEFLFHDGVIGQPPIEYQSYILMKHVFHCTPSQLKKESFKDIQAVLTAMDIEAKVQEFKSHVKSGAQV